ncbi:unnamed protein product [Rangifer tarandus platyrhynchus]|uniref:Uncharacterized protein n=2 Tax=Rangifer tarandus platyrhynchus TaxID=3082113 RepID=A0AC59ZKT0_RANTA|nr:unnamed protein product [Rangifer tarandus platyrhynchus]
MQFSRQSRRLSLRGGRRETERLSKGHRSWRDSGLAAGLKGGCSGVSQRPALSPPALECSSWEAGSFSLLACKASIPSYVWWYKCSGHRRGLFAPGGVSRPPKPGVRGAGWERNPTPILPPPRAWTVAALPGVVSHPKIRHPPPPALQGIHISQVGRGHRTGSGAFPSPEFCPHLTEKK